MQKKNALVLSVLSSTKKTINMTITMRMFTGDKKAWQSKIENLELKSLVVLSADRESPVDPALHGDHDQVPAARRHDGRVRHCLRLCPRGLCLVRGEWHVRFLCSQTIDKFVTTKVLMLFCNQQDRKSYRLM